MRVLDHVVERTGRSRYEIAEILTYALQAATEQVARGEVLRIPGVGVLAAWKDERPAIVRKNGGPVMTPRFAPARGFRAQVALSAPISMKGKKALQRHRRNHSAHAMPQESGSSPLTTMESIRQAISAQLGHVDPLDLVD